MMMVVTRVQEDEDEEDDDGDYNKWVVALQLIRNGE